jgi:hypothetical protein
LAFLPLPCCQGVGMVGVGHPWPESIPPALGIGEEWACPHPSQATNLGVSKLRKRRSYQRLTESLCARQRSSFFFPKAKMPKRKIFHSCHDADQVVRPRRRHPHCGGANRRRDLSIVMQILEDPMVFFQSFLGFLL